MTRKTYTTRASAIRAAKAACKKAFGECFIAYECVDFHIWPDSKNYKSVYYYELVGA